MQSILTLKLDRDRPIRNRHPWIFDGSVAKLDGDPSPGDVADVLSHKGEWLASATVNPRTELVARILSWARGEEFGDEWLARRIHAAVERRRQLLKPDGACRLIYGEADGLPGLIADKYAGILVLTLNLPFWERRRSSLVRILSQVDGVSSLYERSDDETRSREGLKPHVGSLWGDEPPERIPFVEEEMTCFARVRSGHKTGFYLDQRVNRVRVATYATGRNILNAFSYTGAFGIAALKRGAASVLNLDSSSEALRVGEEMAAENGVADGWKSQEGDAFHALRTFRDEAGAARKFDMVILDPPKFAHSRAHLDRACRGYKDINLLAMRLLAPGGILATFSCTGLVSPQLFRQVVAAAAMDSGRDVRLLDILTQSPDHPVLFTFPESEYLKGYLLEVV